MAVENLKGSLVGTNVTATPAVNAVASHAGGRVRALVDKVEVTAAASATSTYSFGYLPTNAVILQCGSLYHDALSTSGTIDLGLFGVGGNASVFTNDDDCLIAARTVTATGTAVIGVNRDDVGQYVWEHLGATSDPGGVVEVKVTSNSALTAGGTIAIELLYTID